MNAQLQFTTFQQMPEPIKAYLIGGVVAAFNRAQIQEFDLSEQETGVLFAVERELVGRTLPLVQLQSEIISLLNFTEEDAHDLAEKILAEFCGSIRWYFPDLAEVMRSQGFSLPEKNPFPVEQPNTTVDAALAEIQKTAADIPERIKGQVESYLRELLRTQSYDEVVVTRRLQDTQLHGGFGLSPQRAEAMIKLLRNFIGAYRFPDLAPQIDPATLATDVLEPHEVSDITATQKVAASVSKSSLSTQQESLVAAVLDAESLHDRAPELQQRWKMIVEARIGGARDAAKTQSLLTASADGGGLGLQPDEAQRLATLLEQSASGFEKRREEFSVMEKIASVQRSTAGIVAGPEAVQRETQKELNQRFVSMFGKDAVEEIRRETHREIESPEMAHPGEGARTHIAPVQFTQPQQPSPAVAVPLPPPPSSATPSQEPRYVPKVPDKLRQLIDAEAPILPMKPKAPGVQVVKKASDIKQGPRLVGPIDELRIMTMIDFRRLSPDVSVRIQKIRSKIDVIGQDGPHEKIRAVQAVEQSEPMRLYRDLLKRSLISQRSIQELSAEQKSLKQPYLESEEIAALAQFLTQIRYSSL